MIDALFSAIAPHHCLACNRTGALLCRACLLELTDEREPICVGCGTICETGVCNVCAPTWPIDRACVFSARAGVLEALINEYKFSHRVSARKELAQLASVTLPVGLEATLVPVPTIRRHVRERGFDHIAVLAKRIARRQRLVVKPALERLTQFVQHGASKHDRLSQAADAFEVHEKLDPERLYIVLDDITTTGASLKAAARTLRRAGAQHVWALVLARQPLQNPLDDRG